MEYFILAQLAGEYQIPGIPFLLKQIVPASINTTSPKTADKN